MANLDGSRGTGRGHGGPESPLNLDSIFPMKDEASARLMMLKADCLRAAGLIDDAERQTIVTRAISNIGRLLHDTTSGLIPSLPPPPHWRG